MLSDFSSEKGEEPVPYFSAGTCLIYGLFAILGLLFIVMIVPETKGPSLEELKQLLVKKEK